MGKYRCDKCEFSCNKYYYFLNHINKIHNTTKIFFTCNWQNNISLRTRLIKNTPKNLGIWKNIYCNNNINNFDYLIVFDDLHKNLLKLGIDKFNKIIKNNYNKIIFFRIENSCIYNNFKKSWFTKNILPKLKHNYSYENNLLYPFTDANFLNKTYDELKNLKYTKKNKNISTIVSTKELYKTYKQRKKFIIDYSNKYPNSIDIFGRGWNKNILGRNYKGELGSYHQNNDKTTSKYDGLIDYNYSICLDNFPDDKCVCEKIMDSILCWTMPIYSGNKCVEKYFPKNSWYLINLNDKNVLQKTKEISEIEIKEKNIIALRKARNLILDKYNIWEQIYQIINYPDEYLKKYQFIL
jgi:hypothetical protein